MEPDEFITREAFERLSEEERNRYVIGFTVALGPILDRPVNVDAQRQLDYITHYLDLVEWVLPPEEYEQMVKLPMWNAAWENAETMKRALEGTRDNLDPGPRRAGRGRGKLDAVKLMIEHKRNLGRPARLSGDPRTRPRLCLWFPSPATRTT